jgi:hypothetical protein
MLSFVWWRGRPRIHRWSGGEQKDEDGDEDGNAPKKEKLGMAFMDRQFSTEAARRKALERARREAEYGLRVDKKRCPVGFEREGVGGGGRGGGGVRGLWGLGNPHLRSMHHLLWRLTPCLSLCVVSMSSGLWGDAVVR